jgi:hypothetical protein
MNKCYFCHSEGRLSREHVLSEPVAKMLGIDRQLDLTGTLDSNLELLQGPFPWSANQVHLPCASCNSGWMNALEHDFVRTTRRWRAETTSIGPTGFMTVGRWLLKTYFALAFQGLGLDAPMGRNEAGELVYLADVPFESMRAMAVMKDLRSALDGVQFGAARCREATMLFGYGNPTVVSPPGGLNARSAGVLAMSLAALDLQLWAVVAPIGNPLVRMPAGVKPLTRFTRFPSLATGPSLPRTTDVLVTYPSP